MQTIKLGKLALNIIDYRGKSVPKSDRGVPLITARNIRQGFIDFKEKEFISSENFVDWASKGFPAAGDVLITSEAPLGMVALFPEGEYAIGQRVICIQPNHQLVDSKYLMYQLLSESGQRKLYKLSSGSTALGIKQSELKKIEVLLVPLEEQKKIAEILSTWDEAIESQKRLLSLYQVKKEALVQKIYDDTEGLATVKIGDFLSESKIPGTNGELAKKLSVKLYGKGVVKKERNIPGSSQTKYFIRKKRQFIYSKLDFLNGAFGIIPNELDGYESTLDMPAFDIDTLIVDPLFFYYLVSREKFYKNFIGFGKGGRKAKRINQKDFLSTEIKIPSRLIQEKIGNVLRLQTSIIENHNYKYQLLIKQKNGLMQRLLTGEIRVN